MNTIRWGILSTARIARQKVIPAMQQCSLGSVEAIASRTQEAAQEAAESLGIPTAYGSYEDLLNAPTVDAVYIPLPNHLHVPYAIQAAESGKHVLCEKPLGLTANDCASLVAASKAHPGIKIAEAFMYRHHPQWAHAREVVRQGTIGPLRTVRTVFSYRNVDPTNIRNRAAIGGGALMDIGCYGVSVARYLFESEPSRVTGSMQLDPTFGTDRLTMAVMDFGTGMASLTCATQLYRSQRVTILGDQGSITIEEPFNSDPERPTFIQVEAPEHSQRIRFDPVNQFTLQADAFARHVLEDAPMATPLDDSVANMRVLDAIKRSSQEGTWVPLE